MKFPVGILICYVHPLSILAIMIFHLLHQTFSLVGAENYPNLMKVEFRLKKAYKNKPSLCLGSCDDWRINILKIFLKHHWKIPETSLKDSWNIIESSLKYPWNILEKSLNILETSLRNLWIMVDLLAAWLIN